MKPEIDTCITPEFVYEVEVQITADGTVLLYNTTFNIKQPQTAINRAIRHYKIKQESVEAISIKMVKQLGFSQL